MGQQLSVDRHTMQRNPQQGKYSSSTILMIVAIVGSIVIELIDRASDKDIGYLRIPDLQAVVAKLLSYCNNMRNNSVVSVLNEQEISQ